MSASVVRRAVLLRFAGLVLAGVLLPASACRRSEAPPAGVDRRASTPAPPPPAAGFPRRVVDGTGQALELAAPPRRIVSQTLGTDELLFAIVDPSRIIGVSTLARDPKYSNVVEAATRLGAPPIESAEQVLQMRPDMVFVASFSRAEVIAILQAGGAPVYRFAHFDRIDDVRGNIVRLGEAVGAEAEAARLVDEMDRRLAAVQARRTAAGGVPPRVLSFSPSGFTAGAGTLFDDIVRAAGAVNIVAAEGLKGFPRVSAEQVLQWQPDFIVVGVSPGEQAVVLARLRENAAVAATRALRSGRVIFIDNRTLLAVSHHLVAAVETLAAALDAAGPRQ